MLCTVPRRSFLLLMLVGWLALLSLPASAEPVAIRTTPLDGEILQRTPTAVGIGFDVPLDQGASTFELRTPVGEPVDGLTISWSGDSTSVTITLPRDFPDGVYTIVWHAVSAEDGSATNGWSSFSVGNPEDANILTIPTSESGHSGPPTWLQAGARWMALAGVAASISIWPIWRGVMRPSFGQARSAAGIITRRWQQVAWISLAVAIVGSLAELVTRSLGARDASVIDAVMQTLGHDEWGFWWLTRMFLLVLLGIGLAITPWWYARWSPFNNGLLWTISLLLPITLVLSGHAMDDEIGRITTIAMSHLHLLAMAILFGGAIGIVITNITTSDGIALQHLRSRSVWLIASAGMIALLTAVYLGNVYAGNADALTQTTYGGFLLGQIVIAVIAIAIAVALLIAPFAGALSRVASAGLAVALAVLLFFTAGMDVVMPARADLIEQSVQTQESLDFDGRRGILLVAPGRAGVNHLRLETPGTYLQTETEVYLDLSSPNHPDIGSKTIQMYRVQGNAFEHHGTEFSLIGEWDVSVRIEEPGFPSSTSSVTQTFGEENESVQVPDAPWKFDALAGLAGISLVVAGVLGLSTAMAVRSGPLRKEAGGLAVVALALAVVVIIQGRIDPLLVVESGEGAINPNDMAMVVRGEGVYTTYCLSCHGEALRGDGPLSEALNPPATDFDAPHARVHPDADLIYWIQNGVQGTAMPGFRSQLGDQDIRDVIAYIQNWQQNPDERAVATPTLGVCEVSPLTFADIPALFHHGIHPETRRGTPLVRASDATVSSDVTNDVMWTLEQMVNCANQDQYLSQLRLFTQPMLQEVYPQGASYEVTSRATSPSEPLAPADAITIQDVQSLNYLADGRIAVTVIFTDPLGVGVVPGAAPLYSVTLVLVEEDGVWLIDEVR